MMKQAIAVRGAAGSPLSRLCRFFREVWRDRVVYLFLAPFLISFLVFIFIPVLLAALLSLTSFNGFSFPRFVGIDNFIAILSQDLIFLKFALANTLKFAIIVGPGGYILSFGFAWLIHQLPKKIRDYYTLAFYAPSLAGGVALVVVWGAAFSGDRVGAISIIFCCSLA
ncbi:hypothetical protein [Paenibacillus mendelii]|uniref:Sugar ABC transporter permease n=1 Tax=Paenibacillus mendelii TaxID=206163 RepID=A0ABV6JMQ6_9BACL|nr:hypothetical protein [Paenibacillus mendelii]MCQ6558749.1 hypothetical protein [Paenibacillus mendelii]